MTIAFVAPIVACPAGGNDGHTLVDCYALAAEIEAYFATTQIRIVVRDPSGTVHEIPGHHPIAWHRDHPYEEAATLLLSFLIQKFRPQVFFDVGAAWGYYTRVAASHCYAPPSVHAFEMLPSEFASMARGLAADGLNGRVEAHLAALSHRHEGERELWFVGAKLFEREPQWHEWQLPWWQRLKFFLRGQSRGLVKAGVLLTSVDEFVSRREVVPGLLKIDVEGYEGKVIRGGLQTFARHRPLIALELHRDRRMQSGDKRHDVVALLLDIGYRALFLTDHRDRKACRVIPVDRKHPLIARQKTDFMLFC